MKNCYEEVKTVLLRWAVSKVQKHVGILNNNSQGMTSQMDFYFLHKLKRVHGPHHPSITYMTSPKRILSAPRKIWNLNQRFFGPTSVMKMFIPRRYV